MTAYQSFDLFYYDPDKERPERVEFFAYCPPALPPSEQAALSPEERLRYLKLYARTLAERAGVGIKDALCVPVVREEDVAAAKRALKPRPVPTVRRETEIRYLRWRLATGESGAAFAERSYDISDWNEGKVPLIYRKGKCLEAAGVFLAGRDADRVILDIGAVIDAYTLYVNGKRVASHDGYEPHRVDITRFVLPGEENRIGFFIPANGNYPIGIGDRLTVLEVNESHIEHSFVFTEELREDEASIGIRAEVAGEWDSIRYSIAPWFPREGAPVAEGELSSASGTVTLPHPVLWEVGAPHLYAVTLRLIKNGVCADEIIETFGVRTVEEKDGKLYLNGKRFFMKSFGNSLAADNDPEPYGNLFPPDSYILRDMLLILKAGGNFMRIHPWGSEGVPGSYMDCGWPEYGRCLNGTNYERFADIADQLGILLTWITRHWCNWPSGFVHHFEPDKMKERLVPSIRRVQNHPSVAIYEGLNEVGFMLGNNYLFPTDPVGKELSRDEKARQTARYQTFLNTFTDLVNEMDGTRLILPDSPWGPFYTPSREVEAVVRTRDLVQAADRSLYDRKNTVWDVHTYSGWYSGLQSAFYYRDMSWGMPHGKPVLLSELGAEAMPDWERYEGTPWYGVWVNHHHRTADFERNIYGRPLRLLKDSEADISQAYQGLCILYNAQVARMTGCDGMNINLIGDGPGEGTYHKGVTDLYRRAKLGYFAARDAYGEILMTGTGQSFCLGPDEPLCLRLSKEASVPPGAYRLTVTLSDEAGEETLLSEHSITLSEAAVQEAGEIALPKLPKGLYRVTYRLDEETSTHKRAIAGKLFASHLKRGSGGTGSGRSAVVSYRYHGRELCAEPCFSLKSDR